MKQSKLVVLVLLVLVATPLMHLSGTVSAQSYDEGAYGGRAYDHWTAEDADQEGPENGTPTSTPGQSPGIVIVPEDGEHESDESLQVDSPGPSDTDGSLDHEAVNDQSGDASDSDTEREHIDPHPTSSLSIWLSIGAVVTALLLFLIALLRRIQRDHR